MKIIKIEAGKKPEIKEIESGLESLQSEVEGWIEAIYPFEDKVALICNEDGKINGMELNRALKDENGHIYDIIAGSFLVVGLSDDDFCSLSDEQIEIYKTIFEKPERFYRVGDRIHICQIG